MALQEKLDRFNKQQEKCQSMLSNIAAKSASSRATTTPKPLLVAASPFPSEKTPAPVKFSNDTERLQHINSIRKAPVGAQMKRVIDILFQTRQASTPEQINEACYVYVNSNKDVFEGLRKNPKVTYDGKRFFYRVLKAEGQIWLPSKFDSQEDIAFPNDPGVPINVDIDLKELFRSIELPRDMLDIEKDLQKKGMKPATNTVKRRAAAQVQGISSKPKPGQKKKEFSQKAKLTNAHLPELFQKLKNT